MFCSVGDNENKIRIWLSSPALRLVHTFAQHTCWVPSLSFTSVGGMLMSGSNDKSVCLFDLDLDNTRGGMRTLAQMEAHKGGVMSVCCCRTPRRFMDVLTGSLYGSAVCWEMDAAAIHEGARSVLDDVRTRPCL